LIIRFHSTNQRDQILRANENNRRGLEKTYAKNLLINPNFGLTSPLDKEDSIWLVQQGSSLPSERRSGSEERIHSLCDGNPILYTDPSGGRSSEWCNRNTVRNHGVSRKVCLPEWLRRIEVSIDTYCPFCPDMSYDAVKCQMYTESRCNPHHKTGSQRGLFQISEDIWMKQCAKDDGHTCQMSTTHPRILTVR